MAFNCAKEYNTCSNTNFHQFIFAVPFANTILQWRNRLGGRGRVPPPGTSHWEISADLLEIEGGKKGKMEKK